MADNPQTGTEMPPESPDSENEERVMASLIGEAKPSSNVADDSSSPTNDSNMADDSLNQANDSSNVADPSNLSMDDGSSNLKALKVSFRALEKSGDGGSDIEESRTHVEQAKETIPKIDEQDDDTESGISDFGSETETEEDYDEDLPIYPSETDEEASSDEDRRVYASGRKSQDLKAGEY